MVKYKSPLMTRVESQYGTPFWEVVKGYADDGESIAATAHILGYKGSSSFYSLIERHGKSHWFKKGESTNGAQSARQSRIGVCSLPSRESLKRASQANPNYVWINVGGVVDTVAGHCKRLGISKSTVYKRKSRGLSWGQAIGKPNSTIIVNR